MGALDVRIGIDIGQRRDPTAIAVVERIEERFEVRHLERLPLGTAYPVIARRVAELFLAVMQRAHDPWVIIDATGVGVPVIDLIREEGGLARARITGVFFTHGDSCKVRPYDHEGTLGKAFLVSRLQALVQARRLVLPETSEARALADELGDYEIRVDERAGLTAGAFKVGAHDDLVTALGLACLIEVAMHKTGTVRYW